MFSGCFTALKSHTTETSPHKDALGKNVLLKVNSLQSFKKGLNYKQNDFQRVKEHKVSGTVIKSNFLYPVCFISPEIEVQRKRKPICLLSVLLLFNRDHTDMRVALIFSWGRQ